MHLQSQAYSFRDHLQEIWEVDADVFGVSTQTPRISTRKSMDEMARRFIQPESARAALSGAPSSIV